MAGALLKAAKFLTGGKFHWRAIPTALVGMNLLSPRTRMNPAYQQMSMYQGMGGMGMGGMGNPNTPMVNPGMAGRPY